MPTGHETSSLHGLGRMRLPPALTASQISKLNIKVKEDVKKAGQEASRPAFNDDLFDEDPGSPMAQDFLDVLDGDSVLDVSHAGGEFDALRDESTTTKSQRCVLHSYSFYLSHLYAQT